MRKVAFRVGAPRDDQVSTQFEQAKAHVVSQESLHFFVDKIPAQYYPVSRRIRQGVSRLSPAVNRPCHSLTQSFCDMRYPTLYN